MSNLAIQCEDIKFINPFILASSPISRNAEMILRAFKAGWAGAVTKTICLNNETIQNVTPRMYGYNSSSKIIGLNNIELISERPLSIWIEEIKLIKGAYPDRILIASIMAEAYNYSAWQELTQKLQGAGADIIELNLSCPHGMPERGMGSFLSDFPEISANIIKLVKEVSIIPVWAKLSPNVSNISHLANICLEAGATGIVAINTVKGFSGIDIETQLPKLNINGASTYGGFSGKLIKPIALKAVAEIASENNCVISATGGISNWQDGMEFILLGASTLQICTEVMFNGFDIINNLISGIEEYLIRHNVESLQELIGLSLNQITKFGELNKSKQSFACIDQNSCLKCGKCYVSCRDGGYQAINLAKNLDKFSYFVNKNNCTGCGLCSVVCPVSSIIMQSEKYSLIN